VRAQIDVKLELEPVLITVEQMMALCQIGQHKAAEWTRRKDFPVIREGQLVLIPLDGLKQWIAARSQDADSDLEQVATPLGVLPVGAPARSRYHIGSRVQPRPGDFVS
jgi:hypothetical protein